LNKAISTLQGGNTAAEGGGDSFQGSDGLDTIIAMLQDISEEQNTANRESNETKDQLSSSWSEEQDKLEKAQKTEDNKLSSNRKTKAQADEDLTTAQEALATEKTTMSGLQENKSAIDKVCVAKGASHEENKAKREAEIASLEEALKILSEAS